MLAPASVLVATHFHGRLTSLARLLQTPSAHGKLLNDLSNTIALKQATGRTMQGRGDGFRYPGVTKRFTSREAYIICLHSGEPLLL